MLETKRKRSTSLALCGIIASAYFIVCMVFMPLSYGGIQVRFAEALTVLPLFFGEAVWGLAVGCLFANFFGNGPLDIIFGTLATLISAIITYIIGKKIKNPKIRFFIGAFPPIIINAIIVPFTFLAVLELKELYLLSMLQVFVGQFLSIYLIGSLIYFPLQKILTKKINRERF